MSTIAFACTGPDRAVLAVDTDTTLGGNASKLLVLPHVGATLAGCGIASILALTHMGLMLLPGTFEDAHRVLPEVVRQAYRSTIEERPELQDRAAQRGVAGKLILVGVSGSRIASRVVTIRGDGSVAVADDPSCFLSPPPPTRYTDGGGAKSMMLTDDGVRAMLRAQVGSQGGAPGFGGRAIVARLTGGNQPSVLVKDLGPIA